MKRQSSTSSIHQLLDPELDDRDVFDPPAWRPGRYLQFADISLEDEPSIRPVSLSLGSSAGAVPGLLQPSGMAEESGVSARLGEGAGLVGSGGGGGGSGWRMARQDSFHVQMEVGSHMSLRPWTLSKQTLVLMMSCMAVSLTALTLLNFVFL